jgi:hypothetical protein
MARDLLTGRTSLREVGKSEAYAQQSMPPHAVLGGVHFIAGHGLADNALISTPYSSIPVNIFRRRVTTTGDPGLPSSLSVIPSRTVLSPVGLAQWTASCPAGEVARGGKRAGDGAVPTDV